MSSDIEQLKKEFQKIAIVCCVCNKSEEQTRCDILEDTSECHRNMCVRCYKAKENENCDKCLMKLKEHYKKNRNPYRERQESQSRKTYYCEKKIRSNSMWTQFNPQLLELLTYFHAHPHPERRKYEEYEKELERIYEMKKKNKNTVFGEANKRYDFAYIKKVTNFTSEKEYFKYDYGYAKGITLIKRAFKKNNVEMMDKN